MSKFDGLPVNRLFTDTPTRSGADFSLKVDTGSSLGEVFVIDSGFKLLARGQGSLQTRLPKGEYLLKYRAGDNLKEKWISLDGDQTIQGWEAPIPPSAAPISERAGWTSAESSFAEGLRRSHLLSIVIRDEKGTPPADDVRILDRDGALIASLTDPRKSRWDRSGEDKVIGMGGNVAPGGYLVMVTTPGLRPYCLPLWVAPNCATQVFMQRRQLAPEKRRQGPHLASASIFIATQGPPWEEIKRLLALAETAKSVLSHDRPIVPTTDEIHQSLDAKYLCPTVGLLAAHLLRIKYEELREKGDKEAETLRGEMAMVVKNLRRIMPRSPDVGALECALGVKGDSDFGVPPMLAHSWAILQQQRPSVIPEGSYADRIRPAVCATRPWLVFDRSKMTPRSSAVRRTSKGMEVSLPPELLQAVRQLGKTMHVEVGSDGKIVLKRR